MITETLEAALKKEAPRSSAATNAPAPTKAYTAFWPVLIVFGFFVITSVLQLVSNLGAMSKAQTTVAQLTARAAKEQTQAPIKNAALTGLVHDLIELAPTSPAAQQIAHDFRIPLNNVSSRTNAPVPVPVPPPAPVAPAPVNPLNGTVTPKQ